jgi:hypothetical protein
MCFSTQIINTQVILSGYLPIQIQENSVHIYKHHTDLELGKAHPRHSPGGKGHPLGRR